MANHIILVKIIQVHDIVNSALHPLGIDKIDTKQPKLAWCKGNTESEKAPHVQCSAPRPLSRKQSGAAQIPPRVAGIILGYMNNNNHCSTKLPVVTIYNQNLIPFAQVY